MKIAISSTGQDLDSEVDPHFGRCPYFLVVDPETEEFQLLANEGATMYEGAGIKAAQGVDREGVDAVITGSLGPNATHVLTFDFPGIKVYVGAEGTVRKALQQYRDGKLVKAKPATMVREEG